MVLAKINDIPLSTEEQVDQDAILQQHAGTPFTQWEQLRELSHQEFDRLLDTLKSQAEEATADWPRMNQQGRATRTEVTMQKLVRWVVGRERQFAGDRSATRALLKDLQLDPPGKSEEKVQNRAFSSETPSSETL